MTIRERILSVYRGEIPDQVPFMLDLSHWFLHKNQLPWDLSRPSREPVYALIDYCRNAGVGFYIPVNASFYAAHYPDDVRPTTQQSQDGKSITWTLETPIGSIYRTRVWEERSYSWGIRDWCIKTEEQLKILAYALENRTFTSDWENYRSWTDYIGDAGVCYLSSGYSAMGQLLGYWMGIEGVMYATMDWPDTLRDVVGRINQSNLRLIDLLADSPAEIVIMGDNFSSDIQPPHFYNQWSKSFYDEAIKRLHAAGKCVAVHIDGRLAGAIEMIRDSGADAGDAITPQPMGDLTPMQCRDAAGGNFILSGGVSPDLWLPEVDIEVFKKAVLDWLDLKKESPRLIANAGDQVPPGAAEDRIKIMRDLVAKHGRY